MHTKNKIWLLCDYGGVLADDHIPEAESELASLFGCSTFILRKHLTEKSQSGRAIRLDRITEKDFWETVSYQITGSRVLPIIESELTAMWAKTYSIRDNVVDTLLFSQKHGVNLGIATNADRYREKHIDVAIKLFSLQLRIFSSWRIGALKPDGNYFNEISARIADGGCSAEIVFFDDRNEHVEAARLSGWSAFRYTSNDQMKVDICSVLKRDLSLNY